jgi:uncharacterized protein
MIYLYLLVGGMVATTALHALIRRGLRAARLVESATPAALGLPYVETRIPSANGKSLFAWFIAAPESGNAPVLVVLHGWGGNAETMLALAPHLHRAGHALLFFDARCHGRSDGDSFSSLPRFAEDLEHALVWLMQRPGVDVTRVGLIGHSVGAAAALLAASRRDDVAAVISIAAFVHPESIMRQLLKGWRVPFVPLGWYILKYVQHVIGHSFDAIAPLNTIARVRCPVLLIHGTADETVPASDAQILHARCQRGVGELLLVSGGHDRYDELESEVGLVVSFLARAMKLEGPQQILNQQQGGVE